MKKLLLATAIAALSVSAANAAPTVYGKAFVTMDYVNADDGAKDSDSVQINSNPFALRCISSNHSILTCPDHASYCALH